MNSNLTQHSDGSWHFNKPVEQDTIARRLYNATWQQPNFEFMYKAYMSELTHMLYMNRDFIKQIAYFRYVDGSTINLNQLTSSHTPPCVVCADFRKCTCEIVEGLDL